MTRIDKIKEHLTKHKTTYIVGGCFFAFGAIAAFTWSIMRSNTPMNPPTGYSDPPKNPPTGYSGASLFNSNNTNSFNSVVNVFERQGRGHTGYITRCIDEDIIYPNQIAAAIDHGAHPNHMSDHLNDRLEHVAGHHFERLGVFN